MRLLKPKINLPSGGSIVIESTEALTVIDVNSGKFTGGKNLEDTIVKTNIEAAAEIAPPGAACATSAASSSATSSTWAARRRATR